MVIPFVHKEITHFIPPEETPFPGHLGRYVFPLPDNVLQAYLEAYTQPGEIVLDPFTRGDALARAAAHTGRKAILSDSNPVAAFIARAPLLLVTGHDLKRAFQRLAESKIGGASLASHLESLYATKCPVCGSPAVVWEALWDGDHLMPVGIRPACKACHLGVPVAGEAFKASQADADAASDFDSSGAHHAFLLERFSAEEHGGQELAARLLDLYTPRTLYAVATLLGRIEGSREGRNLQQALKMCLLECLCACLRKEADDSGFGRSEEIVLEPPERFREINVWRYFGQACDAFTGRLEQRGVDHHPPRLAATISRLLDPQAYGRLGDSPNVVVLRQAARQLGAEVPSGTVSLVICEPPGLTDGRFACFSYLWSGLLFGREGLHGLEQMPCSMRPMDWRAYYRSLRDAMRGFVPLLRDEGRAVFLLPLASPVQVDLVVMAAAAEGLLLRRILLWPGERDYYVVECIRPRQSAAQTLVDRALGLEQRHLDLEARCEIDEALREVLRLRAEPTSLLWLRAAALERLGKSGLLAAILAAVGFSAEKVADSITREIAEALDRGVRIGQLTKAPADLGAWSDARLPSDAVSASDRVEMAVYHHLSTNRRTSLVSTMNVVHSLFSGLTTPEQGWVEECLASYGQLGKGGAWTLSQADSPARRLEEHGEVIAVLVEIGHKLGQRVWIGREEQKRPFGGKTLGHLLGAAERYSNPGLVLSGTAAADVDVIWYDGGASPCLFEVEWSTAFSQAVVGRRLVGKARRYLVLADERLELAERKLARFAWLPGLLAREGWQCLTWSALATAATAGITSASQLESLAGPLPARPG